MKDFGTSFGYQGTGGNSTVGAGSGNGVSTLGSVTSGLLSGSLANPLSLFVLGGNGLAVIRAMQTQGALREWPNRSNRDGRAAGGFMAGGDRPRAVGRVAPATNVTMCLRITGVR